MKTRRIAAAVLFAFLPATVSLPAIAQDDPVTLQARARFKEGVDAFDKGKYEEARLAFLQAYALKKHPSVLLNLAQSSAKSNHPLEASKYFQQYLREATNATPAQKKDAEAGLAEVRQKIGRIDVVAPPGTEVTIDDQRAGTTPFDPVDVEVGTHTVRSPKDSITVTAVAGQRVEARLAAQPAAPAAPEATTPAPVASQAPPSSKHHVTPLTPPDNMVPVYVGIGVTAVAVTSAIVFAIFRSSAQSDATAVSNTIRATAAERGLETTGVCNNPNAPEFDNACATLQDNNDKVDTNATFVNVSIGVAIAGALLAGGWYFGGAKTQPPSKGMRFSPVAGWRQTGFTLSF